MTPREGASQLTIHQVTKADVSQGFQGAQYFCKVGTVEYLSTVRLQVATEHPVLCQHDLVDLAQQISREIGSNIEDLALEQVSPDGGRSTQLCTPSWCQKTASTCKHHPTTAQSTPQPREPSEYNPNTAAWE